MIKFMPILLLGFLTSCSDANMASIHALGQERKITCYSGGKVIYTGQTSGKLENESNSNGFYFKDKNTGKLIEIEADCIIEQL
jgi:hypothetical protein